jgi:hypothetical protein
MEKEFIDILSQYRPISLEEMSGIRLMNRLDTKYVTTPDKLLLLLQRAVNSYKVQVVNDESLVEYRTVYLDTNEKAMYLAHHDGRKVREKIRVRTYVSSHLTFLEVKNKDNHGRTDKKRTRVSSIDTLSEDGGNDFLIKHSWYNLSQLTPQIMNNFKRITLVDNNKTERLTIDLNLDFYNVQNKHDVFCNQFVIIELKRDGRKESSIANMLHELHIKQMNISKYCIGLTLTEPMIKHNRFKPVLMKIDKITKEYNNNGRVN